ncbi:MAG: YifB family Mg chelatase-like AAA ATPase [Myxococcota bacterium]|nr:YifB family Mg chelatase-like AAA ATPase [Myxococcota bacterium]
MARTFGAALRGVDGVPVEVEVRISAQLPRVDVVGLPEAAVRESAARVRAAIQSAGAPFPSRRVTVNLAPAELRKSGAGLDLPIAVGILAAAGSLGDADLSGLGFLGELALDGRLRDVRGALALCLALRNSGCPRVVAPPGSAAEAALAPGVDVFVANDLQAVIAFLGEARPLALAEPPPCGPPDRAEPDLAHVRGQEHAKRALEVAAAGGHGILLRGSPGCGKTMLARRLPGLLPPLEPDEALDVARIRSAAGQDLDGATLPSGRPFRAPHHTASPAGLLGGGQPPRPGEITLAHRGVLFLDELPEFDRRALEALRQVLEDRRIVVARARATTVFPAHFQFAAAANPCPCGLLGVPGQDCRCDDNTVSRYAGRISGPLLDRIDLRVSLSPVPWEELDRRHEGVTSASIRDRVCAARRRQAERGGGTIRTNAEIPDEALDACVAPTPEARALLGRAVDRFGLSARSARRVLRVARSIADLADEPHTGPPAVAEALGLR